MNFYINSNCQTTFKTMIDRGKKLVSRHKVCSLKIWHVYVDPQFLHDNEKYIGKLYPMYLPVFHNIHSPFLTIHNVTLSSTLSSHYRYIKGTFGLISIFIQKNWPDTNVHINLRLLLHHNNFVLFMIEIVLAINNATRFSILD